MITSLLDTDLYKLTMGQAILKLFPRAQARYVFTDRDHREDFSELFVTRLREAIHEMKHLALMSEEAAWLYSNCPYLETWYIDWLRQFRFNPERVSVHSAPASRTGGLFIEIAGPWCETVYWEVPLLAMISELYYELIDQTPDENGVNMPTAAAAHVKAATLASSNVKYADFGTRRRRNRQTHGAVVKTLSTHADGAFIGTSNVRLAKQFGVKAIGTMAHEWVMGVGALRGLRYANKYAMEAWNAVYNGRLGIALTDTYGTDAFLRDFDGTYARLFDGVRQDSGDPVKFIKTICQHYEELGIPFERKTIVFSDSLNAERAIELKGLCDEAGIGSAFGIGTNLTNDDPDSTPLNIVIKLHELDGINVAKLSDDEGKATGHYWAVKEARYVFLNGML